MISIRLHNHWTKNNPYVYVAWVGSFLDHLNRLESCPNPRFWRYRLCFRRQTNLRQVTKQDTKPLLCDLWIDEGSRLRGRSTSWSGHPHYMSRSWLYPTTETPICSLKYLSLCLISLPPRNNQNISFHVGIYHGTGLKKSYLQEDGWLNWAMMKDGGHVMLMNPFPVGPIKVEGFLMAQCHCLGGLIHPRTFGFFESKLNYVNTGILAHDKTNRSDKFLEIFQSFHIGIILNVK